MTILFWFQQDLRIDDNSGLIAAIEALREASDDKPLKLLPHYHLSTDLDWNVHGAQAWHLHGSLAALNERLEEHNLALSYSKGSTKDFCKTLNKLAETHEDLDVYFSRHYEPDRAKVQDEVYEFCQQHGIECRRFSGTLLFEPDEVRSKSGSVYRVFTPFYKMIRANHTIPETRKSFAMAARGQTFEKPAASKLSLDELDLLPTLDWADRFAEQWQPGEASAKDQLEHFIEHDIDEYHTLRDVPSKDGTSNLSAALHFGELSPRYVVNQVSEKCSQKQGEPFIREIIWREFSYHLLHNFPQTTHRPFNDKFEGFEWNSNPDHLKAWQKGKTGYPIVDAGMRQLWALGWMHNRVRMIAGSFLTKDLHVDWQEGAKWFWDTLCCADLANNSMGWQWVAGSGADASPYFRIFNPMSQGEKFDAAGDYIKTWIPELKDLPKKYIHRPWEAPESVLQKAKVTLGQDYPKPIVDHKEERERALEMYQAVK